MCPSSDNTSNKSADSSTNEIADLVQRLKQPAQNLSTFLVDLLAVQCLFGPADSGAILRFNQERDIDVLALYPPLSQGASVPGWLNGSARFARDVLSTNTLRIQSLDGPNQSEDPKIQHHVILTPLHMNGIGRVVTAFVVKAGDKATLEKCSQRLQILISLLDHSPAGPAQPNWQQRCQMLQQAMETLSAVNRQKKFTGVAMAFCNEIASQWQCERVSLGFLKGRYVRLKAISHTEDFSRKMQVVQDIEAAMEECLDQDVEVLSPAPQDSTTIHRAADTLSKRHGPVAILSLPLRREGKAVAVVTLERPVEKTFSLPKIETVRLACELCTARLANLYTSDRWIGAKAALGFRNGVAALVGPKYAWAKVAAILGCAAVVFLIFGKGTFRVKTPFVLEATQQQVIPAPFDGYIKTIDVEVGDTIEAGDSILGSLDTAELRLQLAATKAEKAGYLKQAAAAMRDGETAQAQMAQADADKTQAQIELLDYQIQQAHLISPMSGIVVEGDLKRQIGAPVKIGDILFEICPLDSLRAQLMVPEDEIYDIKVGQTGYLATASYPAQRIKFLVERINPVAEVVNQRNVFKVRVKLLQTYPWIRPGMEGVAKIDIDKRRYVWIWTRKIVNWIRMKLWF